MASHKKLVIGDEDVLVTGGVKIIDSTLRYWWVFFRLPESLELDEAVEDLCFTLGIYPHYSGPGLYFADPPYWRMNKHRHVLVRQRQGIDV